MRDHELKKIIRSKLIKAEFYSEAGLTDSFLGFIEKLKIKMPSKEKSLKELSKYTERDIENAYKSIPKILEMFKSKKAGEDDSYFKKTELTLIKNMLILILLISFAGGILPKNPSAAVSMIESEKVVYKNFDYIGKIELDVAKKYIDKSDSFDVALNKIEKGISSGRIPFSGVIPENGKFRIFKDRDTEIKNTKDFFTTGVTYLKLAK